MALELATPPNAAYANEDGTMIDCDMMLNGELIRFTATASDPEPHGREIFAYLKTLPKRSIRPYVAPKKPEPPTEG